MKFDGLMYPQLNDNKLRELQQSKEESKQSLWKSFTGMFSKQKNYFVSSGESHTKHSPSFALRVYLFKYHEMLTGKLPIHKSPVGIFTDIIYVFNSLLKASLHIDNSSQYWPNGDNIQKVCIIIIFSLHLIIYCSVFNLAT